MPSPTFLSDDLGDQDDSVRLVINGKRVEFSTGWEVRESILCQPACWTVRLGRGDIARAVLQATPPRSEFELYIGGALQFRGVTDGHRAEQTAGSATELEVKGRDALAPVHDTYVKSTVGVNVSTYAELVWFALQQCGVVPKSQSAIDPNILAADNTANRQIKAGVPISAVASRKTAQQILDDVGLNSNAEGSTVGAVRSAPQARVGETWHHFIRRHIDRAGLMLWASAGGGFVLAPPNGNQTPAYQLHRMTAEIRPGANVVAMTFDEDVTHRHSEAIVYGRGGGRVFGRTKAKGGFVDDEMQAFGYTSQPIVLHDRHCHSSIEAALLARRRLAEERRNGWRLEYTISGHTLPYVLAGGGSAPNGVRAVVVPDTVVAVKDDELGLEDSYYIETVVRRRSPQTTTTLRLMRVQDLLFAGNDEND